jgi:hypothetical protein
LLRRLFITLPGGKSTTKKSMILISKIALDRQHGLEYASDATNYLLASWKDSQQCDTGGRWVECAMKGPIGKTGRVFVIMVAQQTVNQRNRKRLRIGSEVFPAQ